MRDDFSKRTADTLAKRAGFRCSNPDCRRPTIGAEVGGPGIVNLGVAAHITAASPNGPRFEPALSSSQRSDIENGIWLCQSCAKLVDSDPVYFAAADLGAWREKAERTAFEALTESGLRTGGLLEHLNTLFSQVTDRPERLPPSIGSILKLSDIQDADVAQRRESVGDLVQWGRLLDGLYSPRPEVLARLLESYIVWLATTAEVLQRRHFPVFWIDGRSGDGKSVLLLQLVASILRSGPSTLVYQASQVDALPNLIDFALHASLDDRLILVVAEDLHRVTNNDAFGAALKLLLDHERQRVAILTCGPTPERIAFLHAHATLEATPWTVPALSSQDLTLFSRWFEAEISPTEALHRIILVELLFSSSIGSPLPAFAQTFADRLRRFAVFETVCRIIAINAFDFGAPEAIFQSLAECDSIQRLAQDDQLHFEWKVEIWGPGVRLVHGAIAWKLFEELSADPLRGLSASVRLARILASVLKIPSIPAVFGVRLMESIRPRLVWLLRDAEVDTRREVDQLFSQLLSHTSDNLAAAAFVVTAILAEVVRSAAAEIEPIAISIAMLVIEDRSVSPTIRVAVAVQLAILESRRHIPSQGLKERAEALVLDGETGRVSAAAVQTLVTRGISPPRLLESWIVAYKDSDFSRTLLCLALKSLGATPCLATAVRRWVRTKNDSSKVEPLAILVGLNNDSETLELASTWIRNNPRTPGVSDVLTALLRKNLNNDSIIALAKDWVTAHTSEAQVLNVMTALLSVRNGTFRSTLEQTTFIVLKKHVNHPGMGNLLPRAISAFRTNQALLNFALDWLRHNWAKPYSGGSVSALLNYCRSSDQVIEIAKNWIASRSGVEQSGDIVSSFLRRARNDPDSRREAVSWILRNWECTTVFNPISTLLNMDGADPEARKLAFDWVTQHPEAVGVHSVISTLIKADAEDVRVHELAVQWIQANPSNKLVTQVLSSLLRALPTRSDLRQVALAWIDSHSQMAESGHLLSTLLFASEGNVDIVERARTWLAENQHRRSNQHQVLAAIIGTTKDKQEWINLAIDMLRIPRPEGEEPSLIQALAKAVPASAQVAGILRSYLNSKVNGIRQRQLVLETWLQAGGSSGPAFDFVLSFLDKDDHPDRSQLFGIVVRGCAQSWRTVLDAVLADVDQDSQLCYAVGQGLASVEIEWQPLIESMGLWPEADSAYVWRGVLRSRCPSNLFQPQLLEWLRRRWRKRGYGVVLNGIGERTRRESEFQSTLPSEIVQDLNTRLLGGGPASP